MAFNSVGLSHSYVSAINHMPGFKKGWWLFILYLWPNVFCNFRIFFSSYIWRSLSHNVGKDTSFFLFKLEQFCYGKLQVTTPDSLEHSWLGSHGNFHFSLHGKHFMPFTHFPSTFLGQQCLFWTGSVCSRTVPQFSINIKPSGSVLLHGFSLLHDTGITSEKFIMKITPLSLILPSLYVASRTSILSLIKLAIPSKTATTSF